MTLHIFRYLCSCDLLYCERKDNSIVSTYHITDDNRIQYNTIKAIYNGRMVSRRAVSEAWAVDGNNARCTQARKTTHCLDGHLDVDTTPRGRVSQTDRGQR